MLLPHRHRVAGRIDGDLGIGGGAGIFRFDEGGHVPAASHRVAVGPDVVARAIILLPHGERGAGRIDGDLGAGGLACVNLDQCGRAPAAPRGVAVCPDVVMGAIELAPYGNGIACVIGGDLRVVGIPGVIALDQRGRTPAAAGGVAVGPDVGAGTVALRPHRQRVARAIDSDPGAGCNDCIVAPDQRCRAPAAPCRVAVGPDAGLSVGVVVVVLLPYHQGATRRIDGNPGQIGILRVIALDHRRRTPAAPCRVTVCPDTVASPVRLVPHRDRIACPISGNLRLLFLRIVGTVVIDLHGSAPGTRLHRSAGGETPAVRAGERIARGILHCGRDRGCVDTGFSEGLRRGEGGRAARRIVGHRTGEAADRDAARVDRAGTHCFVESHADCRVVGDVGRIPRRNGRAYGGRGGISGRRGWGGRVVVTPACTERKRHEQCVRGPQSRM